jgi:GNAT superfamily N-acetyltransferase
MISVVRAGPNHIDDLVDLEAGLFAEDAGRHEPYADVTWPRREGRRDFERLLAEPTCVVLVALDDDRPVGFLVGYSAASSPTRVPVTFAVLRSLYVGAEHRSSGIGARLVGRFVDWAEGAGCVEMHVDSYAANEGAQRFYERHGFAVRSTARVRPL